MAFRTVLIHKNTTRPAFLILIILHNIKHKSLNNLQIYLSHGKRHWKNKEERQCRHNRES